MASVLSTIIEQKRVEIAALKRDRGRLRTFQVPPRRDFLTALTGCPPLAIIAEVKKGSPSKGVIRHDFDPVVIAKKYHAAGAQAVSVLTDEKFFFGSEAYLPAVREAMPLPVLRKDFIIDPLQVEQTAAMGADAMLLIAAALDDVQMKDLYQMTRELGIVPLIEIHNSEELDRAMRIEPPLIGINNRNLSTFVTDIAVTIDLIKHIPQTVTVVSESGIECREQAQRLSTAGVTALLVGESLMRCDDPAILLRDLKAQ